ncbi:hypothetical protein SHI21_15300 [Bacteriovorax sp. PP10]|uniref:Polyprenyl synthetase n=1 Tax=Bacteriovorax antarcticus TaxID=3088717 RepID=A0ABU5VX06_9BACT|nr:hypothetical protein [Bacteriovorax sp. PP10]MEA9357594.1 hypothetical protein [Bacteriovorax sp. PP10]
MGERMLMGLQTLEERIESLVLKYEAVSKIRDRRLFTHFLANGYKVTTLSCVSSKDSDNVVYAKICLGMIITLYDDLADNPQYYNPKLLKYLYQLNVGENYSHYPVLDPVDLSTYDLAYQLFSNLQTTIQSFSGYSSMVEVLAFDIKQVFLANQYSELITANPDMRNMTESKSLGPYNMGMVAAGTIDLMASTYFNKAEMGQIREFLIKGQRLGRIGNLVSTYERELSEGDVTNEILLDPSGATNYKNVLMKEFYEGLLDIKKLEDEVKSIDLNSYIDGLLKLYHLHIDLEGII